ncbi:hypothetical protein ACHAWF_016056 [Thalassiosira exigua]
MLAMALIMTASCHSPIAAAVSDEWCLDRGFDPSNLSCDTCALLEESTTLRSLQAEKNAKGDGEPIDLFAECRSCCQEYKVNPILHPGDSLRGKYRYALMTYNENSLNKYGEIKDFLERDVENVLSFKGEGFRAMKSERQDQDSYQMMMMMGIGGGGLSVPKLMLFEKRKKGGWTEEDEEEAGEVINLRNWKREDIKDMLLTLLPNA